jgi:zinc D-Ala-D-Ala dipeptidase
MPGIHVFLKIYRKKDVDGRNTRLRLRFAGFSLLVRRSLGGGGSPAMTTEGPNLVKAIVIALAVVVTASPVAAQPLPGGFVYLRDIDASIWQDIRYAGSNNFVGRPLKGYGAAECVVKREVGLALKRIQQELSKQNLSLKMFDCYRPARAVADMWAWAQNGKQQSGVRESRPVPARLHRDPFRPFDGCGARSHAGRSESG